MSYPIINYPTKAATDPAVLYRGLGSFWTQIFKDQAFLKGYTTGLAEELIQRYYDLLETVNSYSVKDIDVFHKEKWKPLVIYKSKFGNAPFVFEDKEAVFGPQSSADKYYQDITFQFGFPKKPTADVYLFNAGKDFVNFSIITNKIFDPSVAYIKGADVIIDKGILYFNSNPFEEARIPKLDVVDENGNPSVYTDANGVEYEEKLIILWVYHGEIDTEQLFNSFGYIFNLHLKNTQFFKDILKAIFNLYINGPTVNSVQAICAAFVGITPVIEEVEEVVEIFNDSKYQFVVTDKNVYKFETYHTLKDTVFKGAIVVAGDILVDSISYYDNVITPGWWKNSSALGSKLALSQYLFLGNYKNQLIFPNELDIVSLNSEGDIVFPVSGNAADIKQFHSILNDNKTVNKEILGLTNPGDTVPIQPVDFIMENFLKTNTVLFNFRFDTNALQADFLSLLPILCSQLPPYVFIIFGLELNIDNESYNSFNNSTSIIFDSGTEILNADGSDSTGYIEALSPYGYKDAKNRLFEVSRAIPGLTNESFTTSTGSTMKDGGLLKMHSAGLSTMQVSKLQFLDFVS